MALIGEIGTIGLWGAPAIRTHLPLDASSWQSFPINDGEWKLIHHTIRPEGRPEYELFDAKRDLLDQQNVSAEHADVVQRLSKVLNGWHQMALAAKLKPESEATKGMSAEQLRKLRSLGYIR